MNTEDNQACAHLGRIIYQNLAPLIPGDYILLDLPYHSNIGDILIWLGEQTFLKELPGKCLGQHSKETFDFSPIPSDCSILLHGGGNFGDIWRDHQEFRLKVIQSYPDNNIIIFPQTIHYESYELFANDVEIMNNHRHLTVCARDNNSFKILKEKSFTGTILVLPDMAFCIHPNELLSTVTVKPPLKDNLLLVREDKEINSKTRIRELVSKYTMSDWPQIMESSDMAFQYMRRHDREEIDAFFINDFFPRRIKEGAEFVLSFNKVCSTRLHVAILRLLLGLPVQIIDNSYGKNLSFYNTWLMDINLVEVPTGEELKDLEIICFIRKLLIDERGKIRQEYEQQIIDMKKKLQDQKKSVESLKLVNEECCSSLGILKHDLHIETLKHKKYRLLFNFMLLVILFVFIVLLIIIYQQ